MIQVNERFFFEPEGIKKYYEYYRTYCWVSQEYGKQISHILG